MNYETYQWHCDGSVAIYVGPSPLLRLPYLVSMERRWPRFFVQQPQVNSSPVTPLANAEIFSYTQTHKHTPKHSHIQGSHTWGASSLITSIRVHSYDHRVLSTSLKLHDYVDCTNDSFNHIQHTHSSERVHKHELSHSETTIGSPTSTRAETSKLSIQTRPILYTYAHSTVGNAQLHA